MCGVCFCLFFLVFLLSTDRCKFMDSKMKPLWLMYKNKCVQSDTLGIIFKNGDGMQEETPVFL